MPRCGGWSLRPTREPAASVWRTATSWSGRRSCWSRAKSWTLTSGPTCSLRPGTVRPARPPPRLRPRRSQPGRHPAATSCDALAASACGPGRRPVIRASPQVAAHTSPEPRVPRRLTRDPGAAKCLLVSPDEGGYALAGGRYGWDSRRRPGGDGGAAGRGRGAAAAAGPGAPRARATRDGQGAGARAGPGADRGLERAVGAPGAALVGALPRGRGRGAGRRAACGAAGQGGRGVPAGAGGDGRDRAAEPRPAVRRVDLGPAERLPGRDDRGADRAGLAAGAAGAAGLRLRAAQAQPQAPAGRRRGRRLQGRVGGGGGKRWRPSRAGTSSTPRTRPTWRRTRT